MKRFLFFIAYVFCSVSLMAQTIDFVQTKHDYGKISEDDGVAYHQFEFVNNGDAPLILKKVNTSCGCTTPEWSKAPVAPGQKGTIKVGYNPKGRPNKFTKSITVLSNAKTPTVVLQISGFVNPHIKTIDEIYKVEIGDLRFEKTHLSMGKLVLNSKITDTLKFLNKGLIEAKVTLEAKGRKYINIVVSPEAVKPNEIGNIIVTYYPSERNDWGFVNDRFTLAINGKTFPSNQISISGSIEEDYSSYSAQQLADAPVVEFNTTAYDFGANYPEGTPVEFEFVIKNSGKSDLIIRKVKASCGCTTVNPSKTVLKPGENSTIKALFRTNGYSGRQSKSITVITNDPKRPTMVLRLSGTVVKDKDKVGTIKLDNERINFGKVAVNKVYSDTIVFRNTGKVDVKVTLDGRVEYANFMFVPETVKPNQTGKIIVSFNPQKRNDWGEINDLFILKVNGAKFERKLILNANIFEDFSLLDKKQLKNAPKATFDKTAQQVSLGSDGVPAPLTFILTNKGKEPLIIRKVSSANNAGDVDIKAEKGTLAAGEKCKITVVLKANSKIGEGFSRSFTVITNDPNQPKTTLTVEAKAK